MTRETFEEFRARRERERATEAERRIVARRGVIGGFEGGDRVGHVLRMGTGDRRAYALGATCGFEYGLLTADGPKFVGYGESVGDAKLCAKQLLRDAA